MIRCTHLLKSRHGIYYCRFVLPTSVRKCLGLARREVRVSLRTKDKQQAKARLAPRLMIMNHIFDSTFAALDFETRMERYWRGIQTIKDLGEINPLNKFDLHWLMTANGLSKEGVENYLYAQAYSKACDKAYEATKCVEQAPIEPYQECQAASSPTSLSAAVLAEEDTEIETALKRFIALKRKSSRVATAEKYENHCRIFIKIAYRGRSDMLLSSLSADDMRYYVDIIQDFPINVKSNDCRRLDEIMATNARRLSPKTIFTHAHSVNMFLGWCRDQQYAIRPNFGAILKPILVTPKKEKVTKEKAFSPEHLRMIFGSDEYCKGLFGRSSDFWVPLLGLFTGARQAELCQLEVADVRKDSQSGLWLIDVNDREQKLLKNSGSAREVPVHPQLISLGFIRYVEGVRLGGGQRLFACEERNKRGEFSAFSKRFNRYLDRLGIVSTKDAKLDFHSFRHTLQNQLFDDGANEYVINSIVGHSTAKSSEGVKTYSKGVGLRAKHDLLLKLKFEVDFEAIAPSL